MNSTTLKKSIIGVAVLTALAIVGLTVGGGSFSVSPTDTFAKHNPGTCQGFSATTDSFGDYLSSSGHKKGKTIFGTSGNDVIFGRGGDDLICGGKGRDRIYAQPGDDTVWGGPGRDIIRGGKGIDTLQGEGANDRIFAGQGDDFLYGGKGDDKLWGHKGSDDFDGGPGYDICVDYNLSSVDKGDLRCEVTP